MKKSFSLFPFIFRKRNLYLSLILLVFSILSEINISAQIIPPDRRIEWSPGIPGGIPDIQSPVENIINYGADPSGNISSDNAFQSALNALPQSGGIVYLPEGNYRFTSGLVIERSHIIIRGDGPGKTQLFFDTGDICISVHTYQNGAWQDVVSGYQKGSNSLIVSDGTGFTVGEFAQVQQDNDPDLMFTRSDWNVSWAEHSVGQLFEVVAVNENEVTFTRPLNLDFNPAMNPEIRPKNLIVNTGIEDLYIEKIQATEDHSIEFRNAAYCWVNNIESNHTYRSHLMFYETMACEARNSYFHHSFDYGGGGHGYGVESNRHSTDILVENNIFDSLRHAMIIQVGANGCVYGYNFSTNPVQGAGETNLNEGWIPPDISIHGHYPFMNLFEGNRVYEIGIGDYWGPAGPGNTYFRNLVVDEGIIYYDDSHRQNTLGNITGYLYTSFGNSSHKLEHGNVVDGTVIWNDTIASRELTPSFYLTEKPAFFDDLNWPIYGPEGGKYNKLPAQYRYEQIIHPKKKVTGAFYNKWQPRYTKSPVYEEKEGPAQPADVTITVNAKDTINRVSSFIRGHDLNTYFGKYYNEPGLLEDIQNLDPGILRYPGGSGSDRFFWDRYSWQGTPADGPVDNARFGRSDDPGYLSVDESYILMDTVGATGMNVVNYAYARYGLSNDPVGKAAHYAAEWVRYDNGRTLYWEIGNENYGQWEDGYSINTFLNKDGQPQVINGDLYGRHFRVFADSMRKAAEETGAEIYIGAVGYDEYNYPSNISYDWNRKMLRQAGRIADFIIVHKYFGYKQNYDAGEIFDTPHEVIEPQEVIRNTMLGLGMEPLPVALTEWNIRYEGQQQTVACVNGMHAALTTKHIIENNYAQASRWNMVWRYNDGSSLGLFAADRDNALEGLDPWSPRAPFFYLYYFNRVLGDLAVQSHVDGSNKVETLASVFSSGHMGITMINKGDQAETALVNMANFNAGERYYYYTLSGDGGIMSRKVLINGQETGSSGGGPENYDEIPAYSGLVNDTIKLNLPPYSATYMLIEGTDSIPQYQVSFKVYGAGDDSIYLLERATVELEVLQSVTDTLGEGRIHHLPGIYEYGITKYGYKGKSGNLNLTGDTLITDTLEAGRYSVLISLRDNLTGESLTGWTMRFNKQQIQSTGEDSVFFPNIGYDTYEIEIEKEHYQPFYRNDFFIYSDTSYTIELEPVYYNIAFIILEEQTGKALSGVDIWLNEDAGETNINGELVLHQPHGEYSFIIQKDDYLGVADSFDLEADTSFSFSLLKIKGDVTFRLSGSDAPVNKAEVVAGSDTLYSNSSGMVRFQSLPFDNRVEYSISKEGYKSAGGSFIFNYDTTLNIHLFETHVDIKFHVLYDGNDLENALVILVGDTLLTGPDGLAIFRDIPADHEYQYFLEAVDFIKISGNLWAIEDTVIETEMTPTGIPAEDPGLGISVYPNPAGDFVFVTSYRLLDEARIINLMGEQMLCRKINSHSLNLDISGLPKGMYFMVVEVGGSVMGVVRMEKR